MSLITNRVVNTDLDEELKALGVAPSSHLKVLSEGSDGGAFFSGELFKSKMQDEPVEVAEEEDPLNSPYVNHTLLDRLEALDLESLPDEDLEAILEGLDRLVMNPALTEEEAHLLEGRWAKIKKTVGGFMRRAQAGYHTVKGKIKKYTAGESRKKKRKREIHMRGAGGAKADRYARTRGKTLARRRKRRGLSTDTGLADELRSLSLSENTDHGDFAETIERIGRVMDLISEWIDDVAVDEVLGESFESLATGLYESEEDFDAAVRPTLNLIKRCLEEIEDAEGN